MTKLKSIVKQLSQEDYQMLMTQFHQNGAEKTMQLFVALRERNLDNDKLRIELDLNPNAFYTLRSRLNQRIEEHLLEQMESPRTDLMRKVAHINEMVFSKKKAVALSTLKKLEKELLDYDLSNELTIVYKYLKKLNLTSSDAYHYSQLYNRHVAYMLALDKAEDIIADYFKKYGNYFLSGSELEKFELTLLSRELINVAKLYQSHRLYVYQSTVSIFHRLFIEDDDQDHEEAIEDILGKVEEIFHTYYTDGTYFTLKPVFEFLKLEYYHQIKVHRKADPFYEQLQDKMPILLANYHLYTFPARHLITTIERAFRQNQEADLLAVCTWMEEVDIEADDVPRFVVFSVFRIIGLYYAGKYQEAVKLCNQLLNEVSSKKFPQAVLEIKLLLALLYVHIKDEDMFAINVNSIQRQLRSMEDDHNPHAALYIKLLKTSMAESRQSRMVKINELVLKIKAVELRHFSPVTQLIRMDDKFIHTMSNIH
jgi:hypothetical protein